MAGMMDGHPAMPSRAPDDGSLAVLAAAEDMEAAARREGISPDDPLGLLIRGLKSALVALATLAHGEGRTVADHLAEARKNTDAELKMLRAANEVARTVLAQARGLGSALDHQSRASEARTFEHLVDKLGNRLIAALQGAVLIREHRHNRIVMSWFGAMVALAALGLVISGYAWCAYENRAAIALLSDCIGHSVENTLTHQAYCRLNR